jgi:hypothetical protein
MFVGLDLMRRCLLYASRFEICLDLLIANAVMLLAFALLLKNKYV